MKIQELLDELYECPEYLAFKQSYPDSFFAAGFFILDIKEKTEKIQLDFFVPSLQRIAGFSFPFGEPKIFEDEVLSMKLLSQHWKVDLDRVEEACTQALLDNDCGLRPSKIIAVLREDIWTLTCLDDFLGMAILHIDALSGEVKKFSRQGLMDMVKVRTKE